MTIGTSNVSFSSIASEIGKSQTNLSLRDAAQDTLILNPSIVDKPLNLQIQLH